LRVPLIMVPDIYLVWIYMNMQTINMGERSKAFMLDEHTYCNRWKIVDAFIERDGTTCKSS
jgi:hypothetical protein